MFAAPDAYNVPEGGGSMRAGTLKTKRYKRHSRGRLIPAALLLTLIMTVLGAQVKYCQLLCIGSMAACAACLAR